MPVGIIRPLHATLYTGGSPLFLESRPIQYRPSLPANFIRRSDDDNLHPVGKPIGHRPYEIARHHTSLQFGLLLRYLPPIPCMVVIFFQLGYRISFFF